jgi:uncharacterized protein YecE (DUF72 family)
MFLFPDFEDDPPEQAARLTPKLRALAERGVWIGTSSWKYEGWLGTIYRPGRYETRGRVSKKKFDDSCLTEYAEVFPTVCGDFAFYQFPSAAMWKHLFEETPPGFLFAFKAPEEVTVARWPAHSRYGERSGQANPNFLDAALFAHAFASRLEPYGSRVSTLIFEFGAFKKTMFRTPDAFLKRLDAFLGSLPRGFRYAVEIRNPDYLGAAYFQILASHDVSHVMSAWTHMPELGDQAAMPGAYTADFTVVRALLAKGRAYEQAVQNFEPYQLVKEPNQQARDAMAWIANQALQRKRPVYVYVNNRLEGHAPTTIEAVADMILLSDSSTSHPTIA